jgi:hypothetical protein
MKNILVKLSLFFLVVIIISNILPSISIGKGYKYTTINSEFTYVCVKGKGPTLSNMHDRFQEFKEKNQEYESLILYRTFKMDLFKFWLWSEYLFSGYYKYPYIENQNNKNY